MINKKTGKSYGKGIKTHSIIGVSGNNDFSSTVDGITFGCLVGKPIHSCRQDWPKEEQIRWARLNAEFFKQLSIRCTQYADLVEKESE